MKRGSKRKYGLRRGTQATLILALLWLFVFGFLTRFAWAQPSQPIRLDPENPHYFLFRGKPTLLITSGEHYGAVLNPDFDFVAYLNALQAGGFNLTRVFNGTYYEQEKLIPSLGYQNTLAPRPGRYLAPWARSSKPGFYGGGNKFDLDRWDEAYFARLKTFVAEAGKRGIVVELTFFTSTYDSPHWVPSLFQGANNVNGIGATYTNFFNSLFDHPLVERADALIQKTAEELNAFDNVYYEICDECYIPGRAQADEWQNHLIDTLVKVESKLPSKHMIAWNYRDTLAELVNPNPVVSVFNFHNTLSPETIGSNYRFNKAIALDETRAGASTMDYRREAWASILSGGGVYSHLDWSFTTDAPAGVKSSSSGSIGQGQELRSQLKVLKDFMSGVDFLRMQPNRAWVQKFPEGTTAYALVNPGIAYVAYFMNGGQGAISFEIEPGRFHLDWLNPRTGAVEKSQDLDRQGGPLTLAMPPYKEDIALRLLKIGK